MFMPAGVMNYILQCRTHWCVNVHHIGWPNNSWSLGSSWHAVLLSLECAVWVGVAAQPPINNRWRAGVTQHGGVARWSALPSPWNESVAHSSSAAATDRNAKKSTLDPHSGGLRESFHYAWIMKSQPDIIRRRRIALSCNASPLTLSRNESIGGGSRVHAQLTCRRIWGSHGRGGGGGGGAGSQ